MDLANPQTYAEWYFGSFLQKDQFWSEEREKQYAESIGRILQDYDLMSIIPVPFQTYYQNITSPPSPGWDDAQRAFLGTITRGIDLIAGEEMSRDFRYETAEKFVNMRISVDDAIQLKQRNKITDEFYNHRMRSGGYSESEAIHLYNSKRPYPALQDIITFGRYHDIPDNPKDFVWKLVDIDPTDWDMWNWLSFQKLNTDQVLNLMKRQFWTPDRVTLELSRLGWQEEERTALNDIAYSLPNAMLQVQGLLLNDISTETILDDIVKCDIHPAYAQNYYDAILSKPAIQDVIEYELRRNPDLNNLSRELRRIGIHPQYHDLYQTLAKPIPPVQDIITMAVREAFTPAIAQRFGQYEGMPSEYLTWAERKGLSREWAERYWASHWSLPSAMQGFEMFHRGIIDRADLELLLRALDIMPYWRNKLVQMAFKPLTRVDVRRMFRTGVLDESGVRKAYADLGYDETNAGYMTEFTIRQTRESLSGFRTSDVINAYSRRFIDAGQAQNLLRELGIKPTEINHIINTADNKREWVYKQERNEAIANLYKKGKITDTEARSMLSQLGFDTAYVQTQLEQWQLKSEAEKEATWTSAQTLKFLTQGIISEGRARQELNLLGYNAERINVYIASATAG